ncbi:MAG: hypothetical protein M3295_08470, partial [Chloroflexota bacterium]|nr:hypothetical protein [Chloroflexota bacterium]
MGDGGGRFRIVADARPDCSNTLQEQGSCRVPLELGEIDVDAWQRKRSERYLVFAPDLQRRSAGNEEGDAWAGNRQFGDERRGWQEVLEGVEHNEHLETAQVISQGLAHGLPDRPHRKLAGDERRHERSVTGHGKRHEVRAVAELVSDVVRGLDGQTRFADPGRP